MKSKEIGQAVSEKKTFKESMILYQYIAQGQWQRTLGEGRGGVVVLNFDPN